MCTFAVRGHCPPVFELSSISWKTVFRADSLTCQVKVMILCCAFPLLSTYCFWLRFPLGKIASKEGGSLCFPRLTPLGRSRISRPRPCGPIILWFRGNPCVERRTQTRHYRTPEPRRPGTAQLRIVPPIENDSKKASATFFTPVHRQAAAPPNIFAAFSRYTRLRLASGRPNPFRLQ